MVPPFQTQLPRLGSDDGGARHRAGAYNDLAVGDSWRVDDTYHNIFSFSPPKRFDLGRYRSDERPIPSETFDAPGLVTLRCEIHEHMRGLILVLPTPYFTKTDPDGHFRLGGLPPGHYTLKAWLDNKTTLERLVALKSGSTLRVDFP